MWRHEPRLLLPEQRRMSGPPPPWPARDPAELSVLAARLRQVLGRDDPPVLRGEAVSWVGNATGNCEVLIELPGAVYVAVKLVAQPISPLHPYWRIVGSGNAAWAESHLSFFCKE
jgi:hypothetical protein